MIYSYLYIVSVASLYLSFSKLRVKSPNYSIFILILTSFYILVVGFRTGSTGVDTYNYLDLISISEAKPYLLLEPLSSYFFYILANLSNDSRLWLSLIALVMMLSIIISLVRVFNIKFTVFFLLICFFFVTYIDLFINGMRQGIALGVVFLGLSFIKKYDYKSILFLLPSVFFHYSLILFLVYYLAFVWLKSFNLRVITFGFIGAFGLFSLLVLIGIDLPGQVIVNLTGVINQYLPESISNKLMLSLNVYADTKEGSFSALNIVGQLELLLTLFIPLAIPFLSFNTYESQKFKMFYIIYAISVIFYLVFAYQPNSYRIYFMSIAIIPYLMTFIPYYSKKSFELELFILLTMLLLSFKNVIPFIISMDYGLVNFSFGV